MTSVRFDESFEGAPRFTHADDELHPYGPETDWTETLWFSFSVSDQALGSWLYVQVRPNVGLCSGGALVYRPGPWLPWELPYFGWFHHQRLPRDLQLRDAEFPTGVSVRVIEPGSVYDLGYRFRDQEDFVADLRFEGLSEPVPHLVGAPPFTGSSHFDQHGRVTGSVQLLGERFAVDCFAVRDRSWGRRPEHIGPQVRRLSYLFGTVAEDEGFLVFCVPDHDGVERLSSGYLFRDGLLCRLSEAVRRTERDPATGGIERVEIHGTDTAGRELHVTGRAASRMALETGHLCINTLVRMSVDGREAWGEDQDVWSMAAFAAMRRGGR